MKDQGVPSLNSALSEKSVLIPVLPIDGARNPMIVIEFYSRRSNVGLVLQDEVWIVVCLLQCIKEFIAFPFSMLFEPGLRFVATRLVLGRFHLQQLQQPHQPRHPLPTASRRSHPLLMRERHRNPEPMLPWRRRQLGA